MNNIYDNGELLLGTKKDILNYVNSNVSNFDKEDYEEIIEYLCSFNDNGIVCINYDSGMGLSFDYWSEKDKIN